MTKENVKEICNKLGISDVEVIGVEELCEKLGVSYEEVMAVAENLAKLYCQNKGYDEPVDWRVNATMDIQPKCDLKGVDINLNDCDLTSYPTMESVFNANNKFRTDERECCGETCSCKQSEPTPHYLDQYPTQKEFDEMFKNIVNSIDELPKNNACVGDACCVKNDNNYEEEQVVSLTDMGDFYEIYIEFDYHNKENAKLWIDEKSGCLIFAEERIIENEHSSSKYGSTHCVIIPNEAIAESITAEFDDEFGAVVITMAKKNSSLLGGSDKRWAVEIKG